MLSPWLDKLGYATEPEALHVYGREVPGIHPYALEVRSLLQPDGAVCAQAVFDVDRVPTVVFVGNDEAPLSPEALDKARQKIWNQNLATVVIEISGPTARAFPARKLETFETIQLEQARPDGPFSALDVAFSNTARRLPDWFSAEARVDRKLLKNLTETVSLLKNEGLKSYHEPTNLRACAELLMGQILFISYLEHRKVIGQTYRERQNVKQLHSLISDRDHNGIGKLICSLRRDFNGDFLDDSSYDPWSLLNQRGYGFIDSFLGRTDMTTGQGDFWNYDFSHIPVELLSGLYESFLSHDEQTRDSAYYTPRHLATIAVDQVLMASDNPLSETIFDGACGSGILLTTAYRRLIALSEARNQSQLSFNERADLLKNKIFGADINPMACRVTAFSLYLSLLEGLDPADIMQAQEDNGAKLPTLNGTNLLYGMEADFFSDNHPFFERRFDVVISNPPWKEPSANDKTSADNWSESRNVPFVRRQIAGAYVLRSLDFLQKDGRLSLILPISLFLSQTSSRFITYALKRIQPNRLINFGDLQGLIFPTTEHACHIFLGQIRNSGLPKQIEFGEVFDYCIPKADMSLAYGRLAVQTTDRHMIQTMSVIQNPEILTALMWGDCRDLELWTQLTCLGTFRDFCDRSLRDRPWISRKGVHLNDKSRSTSSADYLRDKPFLATNKLKGVSPILTSDFLGIWPRNQRTVVGMSKELLDVFDGPRVIFPDGFSKMDLSIRAYYLDFPATFTVSVGVISGPESDAPLLKFAAVFLRSDLARYFLMMRGWKMLSERNAVHLSDILDFPFFEIDDAPDPDMAREALDRILNRLRKIEALDNYSIDQEYQSNRMEFNRDVFDYFGLSSDQRHLVMETVDILLPSVRPRNFSALDTRGQRTASRDNLTIYSETLASTLVEWRRRTGGRGSFQISVVANEIRRPGAVGTVQIRYVSETNDLTGADAKVDEELLNTILNQLRSSGLSLVPLGSAFNLVPDIHIWTDGALYLVRPMMCRLWTRRQAQRDAAHIVRAVQNKMGPLNGEKIA